MCYAVVAPNLAATPRAKETDRHRLSARRPHHGWEAHSILNPGVLSTAVKGAIEVLV